MAIARSCRCLASSTARRSYARVDRLCNDTGATAGSPAAACTALWALRGSFSCSTASSPASDQRAASRHSWARSAVLASHAAVTRRRRHTRPSASAHSSANLSIVCSTRSAPIAAWRASLASSAARRSSRACAVQVSRMLRPSAAHWRICWRTCQRWAPIVAPIVAATTAIPTSAHVRQLGQRLGLAQQAGPSVGRSGALAGQQQLDRHASVQLRIVGHVDHAPRPRTAGVPRRRSGPRLAPSVSPDTSSPLTVPIPRATDHGRRAPRGEATAAVRGLSRAISPHFRGYVDAARCLAPVR